MVISRTFVISSLLAGLLASLSSQQVATLGVGAPPQVAPPVAQQCTFTHGYWKSHADDWPQLSLVLGDPAFAPHTYQQHELLTLLGASAKVTPAWRWRSSHRRQAQRGNGASAQPMSTG
jgi:hypothetical protein